MLTPATTCVATYLEVADIRGDTVTSRLAQRREKLIDPRESTTRSSPWPSNSPTYVPTPEFPVASEETKVDIEVRRLLALASLPENWDGAGSAQASPESAKQAHAFLRALDPNGPIPKTTLHANGNALLIFGPDPYAEIEFFGDGRISYYAQAGNRQLFSDDDEVFSGTTIPPNLVTLGIK